MSSPRSIRFEEAVLDQLSRFVAEHPGLSVSTAVNQLVDEALRMERHPGVLFREGPTGRRAVLIGGPDVWEVIRAVKVARAAASQRSRDALLDDVAENTGVSRRLIDLAIEYWSAYPDEVESRITAANKAAQEAEERWRRQNEMLAS